MQSLPQSQVHKATTFQDPIVPGRRGRNEWEANRRYRQVLEMQLIGDRGCTDEQARAQVRNQRPWLYEQTDAMLAARKAVQG